MPKISVILATYNEERNIKDCLETVKWADEIVLVDGKSEDRTVEIAKKYTKRIFVRKNPLMFHKNKQFAIEKAKGDWILYLDADERVTEELKKEIFSIISSSSPLNGYWIPRKNIIFGKWIKHAGWYPDFQLRLFKNGKAYLPCQSVHEQPVLEGKAGYLKSPLLHYNYQTINQFIQKMLIYTENEKNFLLSQGKKVSPLDAIRFPKEEFLKRFFLQKGYKDGLHGLVLSSLQALSALVLFAKIWEERRFKEEKGTLFFKKTVLEFRKFFKEFRHWSLKTEILGEKKSFLREVWFKIKLRLPFVW